eukprot:TRINITY_DN2466_c0_g1_i1.p1 TRINITY_DN2466_c0_g1~~TRINITY_DN2466_c0_g1_i1.p1  ORF type:complete len:121 (+),score=23.21 TRINITY_DN2466_c0_g1_i1:377-739(+)
MLLNDEADVAMKSPNRSKILNTIINKMITDDDESSNESVVMEYTETTKSQEENTKSNRLSMGEEIIRKMKELEDLKKIYEEKVNEDFVNYCKTLKPVKLRKKKNHFSAGDKKIKINKMYD